ncbi:PIN domain-containing protein [Thermosulfurimonas dismutans]|uniref:PIN domain-containing protein n=1 Tax=Thermosulfurimonas dismutans TaxID=999894 RepID=A0A179D7V8_9BACT|nr:PIN domain-containing protein [Thermosulfurimonas dismutans]OAQ21851.1 hypothetical protein TDIS_0369 [Thermosulfurimonas dismutans]
MKSLVVVDTNVIIRYLIGDHPEHFEKARTFWEQVKLGKVQAFIPESVLAETVYVLLKVYGVPKEKAVEKLSQLLDYKGLEGELAVYREALVLFGARKVDIVDAIVLAWGNVKGYRPFSFDRDVARN